MREAYASPRGPIWRCMLIAELVAAALWCVLARSMCAAVECIGTTRMSRRALHALTPTVAVYSRADASSKFPRASAVAVSFIAVDSPASRNVRRRSVRGPRRNVSAPPVEPIVIGFVFRTDTDGVPCLERQG
jgi:hypothetical protein